MDLIINKMETLSKQMNNNSTTNDLGNKTLMNDLLQKILVVDDDEATLFGHEEVFTDLGYYVKTANSLKDALELIDNNTFSIIVTDLNLSNSVEYEGFTIIEKAKKKSKTNIIFVVSAFSDDCIKEQAFNLGADYFIEKPISSERLKLFFEEKGIS
ncbi:MAG: response regulator [Chitinispirillia bacterium]|jgi:DNA-binding response OmpR family regulator